MKKMFSLVLLSSAAFAGGGVPNYPVLVQEIGGLAHRGIVKTCEIRSNHVDLPALKDLVAMIKEAEKNPMKTTAKFVTAQVPSEEIYANLVVRKGIDVSLKQVQLTEVYGSRRQRDGRDAQELIDLVEKLCGEQQ